MIIGLTTGCFDLLHYGHLVYLERCRAHCDKLVVGVDADDLVRATKGKARPIIGELERFAMVQGLAPVDVAFILGNVEMLPKAVRAYRVNRLFKHDRYLGRKDILGVRTPEEPDLAELYIIPDVPGLISTTEIIRRIQRVKE